MSKSREGFIGGSDAAAILGVSPWKSAFQLYQEKRGEWVEEVTPEKQRIFDRGHRWEPVVVEMLADELAGRGHAVEVVARNARYQDPEHPFLAAEIDLELLVDGEYLNGEIKTVHPFAAKAWGEPGTDEIPIYYAAQVMHGLMVRPRERAIVAALIGVDDLRIHWVDRDAETIAGIRARELEFMQRIEDGNPPPPESETDIKWLYRADTGEAMEADAELLELCSELARAKAAAKTWDNSAEVLAQRIKVRMGYAATLLHRGQVLATWKNNKASAKTDWKSAYLSLHAPAEHLREFTKQQPGARPFILKI
jgi:putative phage-type endonuclease